MFYADGPRRFSYVDRWKGLNIEPRNDTKNWHRRPSVRATDPHVMTGSLEQCV